MALKSVCAPQLISRFTNVSNAVGGVGKFVIVIVYDCPRPALTKVYPARSRLLLMLSVREV